MSLTENNTGSGAFVCACIFTKNYFIAKYNMHIDFNGNLDEKVVLELRRKGAAEKELKSIVSDLKDELSRRKHLSETSVERAAIISTCYTRKHPHLFALKREFLHPKLLEMVAVAKSTQATANSIACMTETCAEKVWRFPVFTNQFCNEFIDEMCNFESSDAPKGRPNTMNNYGILLNELGFDSGFLNDFRVNYIYPIARLLLPEWVGDGLDSHKAFTVKYKHGEDLDLSYHFDNAEVTINICLGKSFEDGSLYFGNMKTEHNNLLHTTEVKHKVGYGILHRGQHRHGAMEISGEDSERHNLIVWLRSSSLRNKLCPMCGTTPELVSQPKWGDGFTKPEINRSQESSCQLS